MKEDFDKNRKFTKKDFKQTINNIKKSYKFVKNNKKSIIFCLLTSVLTISVSILIPILSAKMVLDLNGSLYEDLLRIALFILIVYTIQHILGFGARILYKKYIVNVTYEIQKELMKETFKLDISCFDQYGTGIFTDRLRQDTNAIANIFDNLIDLLIGIIGNIGIFIVIFSISKIMFLYFVLCGIKEFIISKKRIDIYYERLSKIRDLEEKNTGLIAELIRGVRDIKSLNATSIFMKKFDNRITEVNNKNIELTIKNSKFYLFSDELTEIFDYMFFLLGVLLTKFNLLTASNFLVLYMYKNNTKYLYSSIIGLMDCIKTFNFSAKRVYEIIDGTKFQKEKFGNIKLEHIAGNFEFKNVSFSYKEDKEILHDISFKVKANTTVAFVGKSGSGKTTLFNLLTKLYNVPDNKIFIDNHDINTLTKDSIRNNISIITQNPYIFNLSIRDNLLLVKENVSEKEMIKACKTACLHDFIMSLPNLIIAHRLSTIINSDNIIMIDKGKIVAEGTHENLMRKSLKYQKLYKANLLKNTE